MPMCGEIRSLEYVVIRKALRIEREMEKDVCCMCCCMCVTKINMLVFYWMIFLINIMCKYSQVT